MTESILPGPSAVALAVAMTLVSRYRLRLTYQADSRLGVLASDYELGAAMWTGKRSAYVGFYAAPEIDATADLGRRIAAARNWGTERLHLQGAERCDLLLVALGGHFDAVSEPTDGDPRVRVSVISIDLAEGETVQLLAGAADLPSARDLRGHIRALRDGATPPTLAAVDLAERNTVHDGYTAPARTALVRTPYITYGFIAVWLAIWLIEQAVVHLGLSASTLDALNNVSYGRVTPFDFGTLVVGVPGYTADWWRYIAVGFLHQYSSPLHVALNCFFMYQVGRLVEQLYGRLVLAGGFILFVIGSSLITALIGNFGFGGASVGASGGLTGLIGLLLVLGRVQGKNVPVGLASSLRNNALGNMVFILAYSFLLHGVVSWQGHLGGFITGALLGLVIPPLRAVGGRDLSVAEKVLLGTALAAAVVALGFAGKHPVGP